MARPETEPRTPLARRLREFRRLNGDPDRAEFAASLGVAKSTLASYERGESEPVASVLVAYRDRHGASLSWLLAGEGEVFVRRELAPPPSRPIDPALLERLFETLETLHAEAGRPSSTASLARQAAHLHNMLIEKIRDVRDELVVQAVIPALARSLMEMPIAAETEPMPARQNAS